MSATVPSTDSPRPRWRELRLSVKLAVLAIFSLLLLGCLELASRVYWSAIRKVPANRPELLWRTFYREVTFSGIDNVAPHHGDDSFDVLLLGASVLDPEFGDIAPRLQTGLEAKLGRKVRVINLAAPARVTLDSLIKYQRLPDRRFDLVLVYHGINDIMLNQTPPGQYRADYTHHRRFSQLAYLARWEKTGGPLLPFTAHYMATSLRYKLDWTPRATTIGYGRDIRTPPAFEANMEAIASIAKERGDRLLLLTYASHIPVNYTEEAFKAKRLDYVGHHYPLSIWGERANVVNALALHNDATRRVAARHPEAQLIEMARLMPDEGAYFNDPCHLTKKGCERFVEVVLSQVHVVSDASQKRCD